MNQEYMAMRNNAVMLNEQSRMFGYRDAPASLISYFLTKTEFI